MEERTELLVANREAEDDEDEVKSAGIDFEDEEGTGFALCTPVEVLLTPEVNFFAKANLAPVVLCILLPADRAPSLPVPVVTILLRL